MNSLTEVKKQESKQEVQLKREVTAKLIAADKARAQALLLQAVKKMEANSASTSTISTHIII